jgi:hypothetical protein
MLFLKHFAVLLQREVGIVPELGGQPPPQQRALAIGRPRDRFGLDIAGLAAPPQPALDSRHRHPEDLSNLLARHTSVDGG